MKGKIVSISFDTQHDIYLKQGVKGQNQYRYNGKYPGGNGTYVVGGEYSSFIWLKIFVYELDRCIRFNIKDAVLTANNRHRVSDRMIDTLIANNVGKKIHLEIIGEEIIPPLSQLELVV